MVVGACLVSACAGAADGAGAGVVAVAGRGVGAVD